MGGGACTARCLLAVPPAPLHLPSWGRGLDTDSFLSGRSLIDQASVPGLEAPEFSKPVPSGPGRPTPRGYGVPLRPRAALGIR